MADFVVILILVCIIGGIVYYLCRAKKRGETCIGCPYAKQCGSRCNNQSGSSCANQGGSPHSCQCNSDSEKKNG